MARMTMTAARQSFADTVNRVVYGKERIILQRRGRKLAAMIPIQDLELLEAIEREADLRAAKKALKEKGTAPWGRVKADLGL